MAAIRRRQKQKDQAKREAQRQKRNEVNKRLMMRKFDKLNEFQAMDSDAESERFPTFRPDYAISSLKMEMQLGWASMTVKRKNKTKRQAKLDKIIDKKANAKVQRYSPGWKPKVKCPVHYRHRVHKQVYTLDDKDPRVTGKQLYIDADCAAGVGDLEMEMALFRSKKDDHLFNKQEMNKPPDEWVHYPRFRTGYLPTARAMASFTVTPSKGIFMFGGVASDRTNELAHLNPRTMKWRNVKTKQRPGGKAPGPRSGHCAVCVPRDHCILFYGGEQNSPNTNQTVGMFDQTSQSQSFLGESRALVEDDLMYSFDYRHERWKMLAPSPNPGPRYAASLTRVKQANTALLIGGVRSEVVKEDSPPNSPARGGPSTKESDDDNNETMSSPKSVKCKKWVFKNDVWMLDTSLIKWTHMKTDGTPPFARAGHSAVCVNTSSLLLFGGMHKETHAPNEMWELKLTVRPMRWTSVHTHGTLPGPRICATSMLSPYEMSSIYVFGGTLKSETNLNTIKTKGTSGGVGGNAVLVYDHSSYRWSTVELKEEHVPSVRYWHMGCLYKGFDGEADISEYANEEKEEGGDGDSDSSSSDNEGNSSKLKNASSNIRKNLATSLRKPRFSMVVVGGTGNSGFAPFDVYALHLNPAPYQENSKGSMFSKLSFKWDSAKHGLVRKPFRTWVNMVQHNKRVRAIEQHEDVLTGKIPSPYLSIRPPDPLKAPLYANERVPQYGFPTGYSSFLNMTGKAKEDQEKKSEFITKQVLKESRKKALELERAKLREDAALRTQLIRGELSFKQLRLGDQDGNGNGSDNLLLGFLRDAVTSSETKKKRTSMSMGRKRSSFRGVPEQTVLLTTADLRNKRRREALRSQARPMTTPVKANRRNRSSTNRAATANSPQKRQDRVLSPFHYPRGSEPGAKHAEKRKMKANMSLSEWGFAESSGRVNFGGSLDEGTKPRSAYQVIPASPLKTKERSRQNFARPNGPTKEKDIINLIQHKRENGLNIKWGRRKTLMGDNVRRRGAKNSTYRIAPSACSSSLSVCLDIAAPAASGGEEKFN